jgi:hypothetical protein
VPVKRSEGIGVLLGTDALGRLVDSKQVPHAVLEGAKDAGASFADGGSEDATEHRSDRSADQETCGGTSQNSNNGVTEHLFDGAQATFDDVPRALNHAFGDGSESLDGMPAQDLAGALDDAAYCAADTSGNTANSPADSSDDSTHVVSRQSAS